MKGARILLLDDNREARWPLANCLRRAGAHVTEADDGTDGMRLLERHEFDVIIADVCMPRLGGFGLFSEMRFGDEASLPFREIPFILITGQVGRAELARGMEAGLDDFVTKPVDLDEFKARVGAVLRRASAQARPTARTHGDLADLRMSDLTQTLALGCSSGRLVVRSGTAFGLLDFHRGHISHAVYTAAGYDVTGDEAALMALGIDTGTFEILAVPESAPRTVFGETQSLLLRAATQLDESATASGVDRDELEETADLVSPDATISPELAAATTAVIAPAEPAPSEPLTESAGPQDPDETQSGDQANVSDEPEDRASPDGPDEPPVLGDELRVGVPVDAGRPVA